ncbi:hypothetical protein GIB67_026158 [Kingdonia uniflora]|uniref:Uncharacterized protein n=1 Tax=Kingdonia uniflora TaxID=39325 RepID=A0A7J7M377_9MAGN|nr:hypothetical protein GIB67_026158 [Kingdonia uniflora]
MYLSNVKSHHLQVLSLAQTSLPLTFFDLPELGLDCPVHCVYLYQLQCSKTHFTDSILPDMKHSLSLTLQHFFSLVGNLTWSPQSAVPEIVYVDGDSISFRVAESSFNFNHLCGNHPRDANDFASLTSHLVPRYSSTTAEVQYPLLALQVTLFPNSGICVGVTMSHIPADGMSSTHFMKFWASVCSNLGQKTTTLLPDFLPSFDRTTIIDPQGIETAYLNYLKTINITQQSFTLPSTPTGPVHDKVVATFIMDFNNIVKLKKWVLRRTIEQNKKEPYFNLTSLIVTSAYVWVCLIKAMESVNVLDSSREHIVIPVDCRTRLDPALPVTYFGNCIVNSCATIDKNDLVGEDGIVIAAEMIGKAIQTTCKNVLDGAENLFANIFSVESERVFEINGSPKMGAYDVNFGWGRPKKYEVIYIDDDCGYITLSDCGDSTDRSLEVSVTLKRLEMDAFASIFHDTLNNLLNASSAMSLLSKY